MNSSRPSKKISFSYAIITIICLFLFIAFPALAQNDNMNVPIDGAGGDAISYIKAVYKYMIGFVGILAAAVMIYAGALWITSGGNSGRASDAQEWIKASLTGLVLALSTFLILSTINSKLVNLEMDALPQVEAVPADIDKLTGKKITADQKKQSGGGGGSSSGGEDSSNSGSDSSGGDKNNNGNSSDGTSSNNPDSAPKSQSQSGNTAGSSKTNTRVDVVIDGNKTPKFEVKTFPTETEQRDVLRKAGIPDNALSTEDVRKTFNRIWKNYLEMQEVKKQHPNGIM